MLFSTPISCVPFLGERSSLFDAMPFPHQSRSARRRRLRQFTSACDRCTVFLATPLFLPSLVHFTGRVYIVYSRPREKFCGCGAAGCLSCSVCFPILPSRSPLLPYLIRSVSIVLQHVTTALPPHFSEAGENGGAEIVIDGTLSCRVFLFLFPTFAFRFFS